MVLLQLGDKRAGTQNIHLPVLVSFYMQIDDDDDYLRQFFKLCFQRTLSTFSHLPRNTCPFAESLGEYYKVHILFGFIFLPQEYGFIL